MLFLLSPAKSLDFQTPAPSKLAHTLPQFADQSAQLVALLKRLTQQEVAQMMEISDALAELNVVRFAAWSPQFTATNAKQAVLAFDGDVYGGLDAKTLSAADLTWAQDHLRILSGLYGVLRPLDYMQPYRLEMGRTLANERGSNLYKFWGTQIAQALNELQASEDAPLVVNLASIEYAKSVDRGALRAQVLDCAFEEFKNGQYKVISFMAKRARGLMARYCVQHRVKTVARLKAFALDGYAFEPAASSDAKLTFRRG